MEMDMDSIFREYGLNGIEAQLGELFPTLQIDLETLLKQAFTGDIKGALTGVVQMTFGGVITDLASLKNTFLLLLLMGIGAALISHFIRIFDKHQVADAGFYFLYLYMAAVLMKCFFSAAHTAAEAIRNIVAFIQAFIPAYFLSVGIATGTMTAGAGYQIILLIIFLVEKILLTLLMPLINSYMLLAVLNGCLSEERMTLLESGMEKMIRFLLKASLGIVAGISTLQSLLTPAIDSAKTGLLQKGLSAIPGVGEVTDSVVDMAFGAAAIIKNGIGFTALLLLIAVALPPLCKLLLTAFVLKAAGAFMGLVSDKRMSTCADRVGNAGRLLFQTVGTSFLLFMITISVAAFTTNR